MSMITATTWVCRGVAAPFPTKYNFDENEFQRIAQLAKLHLDDANEDLDDARKSTVADRLDIMADNDHSMDINSLSKQKGEKKKKKDMKPEVEEYEEDDELKEYDLDHYDDDDSCGTDDIDGEGKSGNSLSMFGNLRSLIYYESSADDPYITVPDNEEDDEDREELQILATDNLVLAAKVEDDVAHLEVYIYEDDVDNLYVHHDIMLPAIPLCVEWLDLAVGKTYTETNARANFVAIGTLEPDIEIWDLDIMDCMYPNAILGQGGENISEQALDDKQHKKIGLTRKEKKKKKKKSNDEYHVDAVLSLAANRQHRNLLASASADKTIKLWDLNTTNCAKSYRYHTDKICSLQWHPTESTVLLSGSYDRTVVAADMRAPEAKAPTWGVESDVETVKWDPHNPNFFYVSTENGVIHNHDMRMAPSSPSLSKPTWILQAHDQSVSAFDINPIIPGFMATGSSDRLVKLWNLQGSGPSIVVSRDFDVGKVFSTSFAPDEEVGFRLAVAGSKGSLHIWDTSTNPAVRSAFADRLAPVEGVVKEKLVGIESDSNYESEDGKEGINT